jgi:hypothetical protein
MRIHTVATRLLLVLIFCTGLALADEYNAFELLGHLAGRAAGVFPGMTLIVGFATSVPEPVSILLLGSILFVGAVVARRRMA